MSPIILCRFEISQKLVSCWHNLEDVDTSTLLNLCPISGLTINAHDGNLNHNASGSDIITFGDLYA